MAEAAVAPAALDRAQPETPGLSEAGSQCEAAASGSLGDSGRVHAAASPGAVAIPDDAPCKAAHAKEEAHPAAPRPVADHAAAAAAAAAHEDERFYPEKPPTAASAPPDSPPPEVEKEPKCCESCSFDTTFSEKKMLAVGWSILFIRYGASTFLSPFFPNVCDDLGIGGTMEGLIFAGYPAGIALISPFAPPIIYKWGTRYSILFGLFVTAIFTVAFGFVPDMVSDKDAKSYLWLLFYTLSGALGTMADTTCICLLSEAFPHNVGKVMAVSNTVMGVGCMAGPALGGPLHEITNSSTWNFRLPFLIVGALPALLGFAIIVDGDGPTAAVPQKRLNTEEEKAPFSDVVNPSVVFASLALFMSGMIVATLDPTLEYRLSPPLSDSEVSAFFTGSSVIYALICPIIGVLCDGRFKDDSRAYKLIQAAGLGFLTICFFLLGPWRLLGWEFSALDHTWVAVIAMTIKGVGSAGNNAAYNDMALDCDPGRPMEKATIGGIWNAVYAVGWAAGPVAGGGVYSAFGSGRDGFAGMASVAAVGCLAVGLITAAAAVLPCSSGGFRGGGRYRALPQTPWASPEVSPHDAENPAPRGDGDVDDPLPIGGCQGAA